MQNDLPDEWKLWISEGMRRGIAVADMQSAAQQRGLPLPLFESYVAQFRARARDRAQPGPLPQEFIAWIHSNVQRGVLQGDMIAHLTGSVTFAWQARNEALRKQSEGAGYEYEHSAPDFSKAFVLDGREIPVLMHMDQPKIAWLGNVLSAEECDHLIEMAKSRLRKSVLRDEQNGALGIRPERTSSGMNFRLGENELVRSIDQRLAQLSHWPVTHGEGIQVMKYTAGEKYSPHFDFFPPENPTSSLSMRRGGQRLATMIVYLNDVASGGETSFPKLDVKIKPRKGSVLYFHYTNSRSQLDRATFHGGLPVIQGEKWIATKWLRQNPVV